MGTASCSTGQDHLLRGPSDFLPTAIISYAVNRTKNGNINSTETSAVLHLVTVPPHCAHPPALALQQHQDYYPGLCTLGPPVMHSNISRKSPKTDQRRVSNHFFKKRNEINQSTRPPANLEDTFPYVQQKIKNTCCSFATLTTLAGPMQALRAGGTQAVALPEQF